MIVVATATFTGVEDSVNVTFPTPAGNFGLLDGVNPTDNSVIGAVLRPPVSGGGTTTVTVVPTARFTGTVDVIAFDKV